MRSGGRHERRDGDVGGQQPSVGQRGRDRQDPHLPVAAHAQPDRVPVGPGLCVGAVRVGAELVGHWRRHVRGDPADVACGVVHEQHRAVALQHRGGEALQRILDLLPCGRALDPRGVSERGVAQRVLHGLQLGGHERGATQRQRLLFADVRSPRALFDRCRTPYGEGDCQRAGHHQGGPDHHRLESSAHTSLGDRVQVACGAVPGREETLQGGGYSSNP